MEIKFLKFNLNVEVPKKAHDTDAGYDVKVVGIKSRSLFKIHYTLGFGMDLPEGTYIELVPRSSIHKLYLWMANSIGIIDNGYKGELQAIFYKIPFISKPYKIGDKCCQMLLKIQQPNVPFKIVDKLSPSKRGTGGIGSTGKR